jgi:hypothetical protein
MTEPVYLELTYRDGKPFAGYLWLPRRPGDAAARSRKAAAGLVVDYAEDGRPIGIEIVSPSHVSPSDMKALLAELHCDWVSEKVLAPLFAVSAA